MKKGLSLIALVASLVIMFLLASTVIISFNSIETDTKKKEFGKEIFLVSQLVKEYEFLNGSYPLSNDVNVDLNSIFDTSKNQFSDETGYATNTIVLKEIDLKKANVSNVVRGTQKYGASDIYLFSELTKKIYYLRGEKIGDTKYYTLTGDLYSILNINEVD
jgi:type II secretory pathway pseudopilin PulG